MGSLQQLISSIINWAVPPYHEKQPYTRTNAWLSGAFLPLLVLQIHLLIRSDPASTRLARASLIPIITLLALKSGFGLYYTANGAPQLQGRGQAINATLGCGAIVAVIRSFEFGLARSRPKLKTATAKERVKENGRGQGGASKLPFRLPGTWWPLELDLLFNTRGLGWEHGIRNGAPALPVPHCTKQERWKWIRKRMAPVPVYFLLLDAICVLLEEPRFNPHAGNPLGGSIWDCSSGTFGRATPYMICMAFALTFISVQYMAYTAIAAVAVGLFHSLPERWDPPIFDAPWLTTSVADFWSTRWHQMLRHTFMTVGYWPVRAALRPIAGRRAANIAAIWATFLTSGLIHEFGRSAMVPGFKITGVTVFFAIQPVAIFGEQLYTYYTGQRVRGVGGWAWSVSWILACAPLLMESYSLAGYNAHKNEYIGVTRGAVLFVLDWWDRTFNGV